MTRPSAAPFTYRLIPREGWCRLPVNGSDTELRSAIRRIVPDDVPRDDAVRLRANLEGRFRTALSAAKDGDGLDVYLPLGGMNGFSIPASFYTLIVRTNGKPVDVVSALHDLGAESGGSIVDVDLAPAVRAEYDLDGVDDLTGDRIPSRRVDYTIPIPGTGDLMIVAYNVYQGHQSDAPHVPVLVEMFDAVMTTFRWVYDSSRMREEEHR